MYQGLNVIYLTCVLIAQIMKLQRCWVSSVVQ